MAIALTIGAAAFLLTLFFGHPYLAFLRRAGLGKQVRIEGPSTHLWKTGTPTLGGLLFTSVALGLTGALTLTIYRDTGRSILLPASVMLFSAALGAYDDKLSLVGGPSGGLSARRKFVLLGLLSLVAALLLWHPHALGIDSLFVPGIHAAVPIGWWMVPLACLAIMGSAHAVNLTDGLDGLAGHIAAVAYVAYGTIAYLQGQIYLVTFCFTIAGALLGFLWFNAYPAQVFMGDTGALALGATLAVVALMLGVRPKSAFHTPKGRRTPFKQIAWRGDIRGRRLFGRPSRPGAVVAHHRLCVRGGDCVGHPPGELLQSDRRQALVAYGAAAQPLRTDGLEPDAGRATLLAREHGYGSAGCGPRVRVERRQRRTTCRNAPMLVSRFATRRLVCRCW